MKLGAVVVTDQAGHLLKMPWFKLDERCRAKTMRVLTAGNESLTEETADGLPAVKPQKTGMLRVWKKKFEAVAPRA